MNEFAVGALAKVGLGLLKKKKQIVPGTSVKSGISRLQPRRTSATLSPTAQAATQRKAAALKKTQARQRTKESRNSTNKNNRFTTSSNASRQKSTSVN